MEHIGLLIINFQNSEMHPNAETLPNNTKYEYNIYITTLGACYEQHF